MKKTIITVLVLLVVVGAGAQWYYSDRGRFTTEPEYSGLARTLSGNELLSIGDPSVILRFDSAYHHVGGQKFVLYGIADTEQHFFVETTADNKLKSVFWLQFEAYLPGEPYTYDYEDSPLRLMLDDYEFYTDTAVVEFDPNKKRRRGTDGALAREFLADKGYVFPENFAYARLVYLTDESRQKELMIIFIDDLEPHGLTAAELDEGGPNVSRWPDVEQAHLDKIKSSLRLFPN